jgi:hypothetical protein
MVAKKRRPRDLNLLARSIVADATGEGEPVPEEPAKNPAAVALGRLGGSKGGKAAAANMTKAQRKRRAQKAIAARWKKAKRSK